MFSLCSWSTHAVDLLDVVIVAITKSVNSSARVPVQLNSKLTFKAIFRVDHYSHNDVGCTFSFDCRCHVCVTRRRDVAMSASPVMTLSCLRHTTSWRWHASDVTKFEGNSDYLSQVARRSCKPGSDVWLVSTGEEYLEKLWNQITIWWVATHLHIKVIRDYCD